MGFFFCVSCSRPLLTMFWFCVVFCLVLLVFCQRVYEKCWRLTFTKYTTICPDAMRLELWMCLDDVTFEFPIPGTPSDQLHLSQSDAIHPLHRVVELEIWGGFHWPCLCVWLCRCHSKLYPLPLFQTAGSIAFQQNDDGSSYISAG